MKKALLCCVAIIVLFMPFVLSAPTSAQESGTITVETLPGPTVSDQIIHTISHSWPWYLARGSGIVAALSMVLLMLSGIGQITGKTFKFLDPLSAWASHRALGIMFGISIVVHVVSLLFDSFLKFTVLDALIPWHSDFKPVHIGSLSLGSLHIALGIFAFYLSLAIVITSILWISKRAKLWKLLHVLSYEAMLMVFFHVLMIGTDFDNGILRTLWIVSGILLAVMTLARSWRSYTT